MKANNNIFRLIGFWCYIKPKILQLFIIITTFKFIKEWQPKATKVTMKAWRLEQPRVENLHLVNDDPIPQTLEDYEVLIKVLAVGLNPVDYKRVKFRPKEKYPFVVGLDIVGIVEKRGSKVDENSFVEGGTVVLLHGSFENRVGYFAEFTLHDSRYLSIVPKEIYQGKDLAEVASHLAGLPCASFTAYQIVFNRLRLFPQDRHQDLRGLKNIVVSAASGGLGGFALQFLRIWRDSLPEEQREQVKLIATCSKKNGDDVTKLGATHAVDYSSEDVVKRLQELTDNKGVDVFIDNVGFENKRIELESLGYEGQLIISVESGDNFGVNELWSKAQSVHSIFVPSTYLSRNHDKMEQLRFFGDEVLKFYAQNQITSLVSEILPFERVKDGLEMLEGRHVRGKLVAKLWSKQYDIKLFVIYLFIEKNGLKNFNLKKCFRKHDTMIG